MIGRHESMLIWSSLSLLKMMMATSAGCGTGKGTQRRGNRLTWQCGNTGHRLLSLLGKLARWVPVIASGLNSEGSRYGDWMWILPRGVCTARATSVSSCQSLSSTMLRYLVRFQCSTHRWKVVSASCIGVRNSGEKISEYRRDVSPTQSSGLSPRPDQNSVSPPFNLKYFYIC